MSRFLPNWFALVIVFCSLAIDSGCSSKDPVEPTLEIKTVTVVSGPLGPFWPEMIRGDCEFAGHGPSVTLRARLYVRSDSLFCYVYMKAEETESNWSTAEGEWDEFLYRAPAGWKITHTNLDPDSCETRYIDDGGGYDYTSCPGFSFRSIGDTSGNDICGKTLDDTHVVVTLDTLLVEIRNR
jgi:hypothetical protein